MTDSNEPTKPESDMPNELEQVAEVVAKRSAMSQLIDSEFSFAQAIGGVRGLVESMAPGLVFVITYLIWDSLRISVVSSLGVAVIAGAARLIQRTPLTQALAGLGGVAIGAFWAWRSGEAQNYFAFGFWTNAVYALVLVVSIVARWPLIGVVVGLLQVKPEKSLRSGFAWRHDPRRMKVFTWASWIWVGMFVARLAVQLPMYYKDEVLWLGTARLVMGVPLWAAVLWVTWLLVRGLPKAAEPDRPPARE